MRGHLSFARFAHACGLAFADARKAFTIELLAGEVNTSAAAEYVTHDRAMTLAEELESEGWRESAVQIRKAAEAARRFQSYAHP